MSSAEVLDMNGHNQNGLHHVKDSTSSSSSSDESSSSEETSNTTSSSSPAVVSPTKPQSIMEDNKNGGGSFSNDGEPEYKPRKVPKKANSSDSSETESEGPDKGQVGEDEDDDEDETPEKSPKKVLTQDDNEDVIEAKTSDSSSEEDESEKKVAPPPPIDDSESEGEMPPPPRQEAEPIEPPKTVEAKTSDSSSDDESEKKAPKGLVESESEEEMPLPATQATRSEPTIIETKPSDSSSEDESEREVTKPTHDSDSEEDMPPHPTQADHPEPQIIATKAPHSSSEDESEKMTRSPSPKEEGSPNELHSKDPEPEAIEIRMANSSSEDEISKTTPIPSQGSENKPQSPSSSIEPKIPEADVIEAKTSDSSSEDESEEKPSPITPDSDSEAEMPIATQIQSTKILGQNNEPTSPDNAAPHITQERVSEEAIKETEIRLEAVSSSEKPPLEVKEGAIGPDSPIEVVRPIPVARKLSSEEHATLDSSESSKALPTSGSSASSSDSESSSSSSESENEQEVISKAEEELSPIVEEPARLPEEKSLDQGPPTPEATDPLSISVTSIPKEPLYQEGELPPSMLSHMSSNVGIPYEKPFSSMVAHMPLPNEVEMKDPSEYAFVEEAKTCPSPLIVTNEPNDTMHENAEDKTVEAEMDDKQHEPLPEIVKEDQPPEEDKNDPPVKASPARIISYDSEEDESLIERPSNEEKTDSSSEDEKEPKPTHHDERELKKVQSSSESESDADMEKEQEPESDSSSTASSAPDIVDAETPEEEVAPQPPTPPSEPPVVPISIPKPMAAVPPMVETKPVPVIIPQEEAKPIPVPPIPQEPPTAVIQPTVQQPVEKVSSQVISTPKPVQRAPPRVEIKDPSPEEAKPLPSNNYMTSSQNEEVELRSTSPKLSRKPHPGKGAVSSAVKNFSNRMSLPDERPPPVRSPSPSSLQRASLTKMYTQAIQSNNASSPADSPRLDRKKPAKDITQIYTQNIARASPPVSPKPDRSRPGRDITHLYTDKLEPASAGGTTTTPPSEKLSPRKHNMATNVDRDAIREAYEDVRSDTTDTEWSVFKFEGNKLGLTAKGKGFPEFKACFEDDDRGFGYIRIQTGDEMSKRAKFVLVTWVGPGVSVMKKAKMSTDKALMKDIVQNLSVELQLENHAEFSHELLKVEVDKAAGAMYGTGVRDL